MSMLDEAKKRFQTRPIYSLCHGNTTVKDLSSAFVYNIMNKYTKQNA